MYLIIIENACSAYLECFVQNEMVCASLSFDYLKTMMKLCLHPNKVRYLLLVANCWVKKKTKLVKKYILLANVSPKIGNFFTNWDMFYPTVCREVYVIHCFKRVLVRALSSLFVTLSIQ